MNLTSALEHSLRRALRTTYHAVAADIDGTLTAPEVTLPSRAIVGALRRLLIRGVRIVFVTGRGASAQTVIRQVLEALSEEPISSRYLRRVHCLIDNGATMLEPSATTPLVFTPRPMAQLQDPDGLTSAILDLVRMNGGTELLRARSRPERIRLEFASPKARDSAKIAIFELLESTSLGEREASVACGVYRGSIFTIDLTPTTKGKALSKLCAELGIDEARCLRLGDQGAEDGNDHDLLDSQSGFTVGAYSESHSGCHLVVSDTGTILKNAAAADYLLDRLSFSAQLASPPTEGQPMKGSLARFERDVRSEAHRQLGQTFAQFARSMGNLFSTEQEVTAEPDLVWRVYDRQSGAVRLDNWEVMQESSSEPLGELFGLRQFDFSSTVPTSEWAMYTDSAIILRGPAYYLDWSRDSTTEVLMADVLLTHQRFLGRALTGMATQIELLPSVVRMKLFLGVADNVRDLLIKLTHFAFALHSELDSGPDLDIVDRVAAMLATHTDFLVGVHTENQRGWRALHEDYFSILSDVYELLSELIEAMGELDVEILDSSARGPRLFRARECDWLLESIAACQLGLDKHTRQQSSLTKYPFAVIGLAYGGMELPFICRAIGMQMGVEAIPGIMAVSSYTRKGMESDPARDGLTGADLNVWIADRARLHSHGAVPSVLLADDNMTTARSLQRAWTGMQENGYDVLGAIVVRYPGLNRFVQMEEIDRSIPDPELFMAFVRGLVSPAPYARRVSPCPTSPNSYLDFTGGFNKMDDRIKRYISKAIGRSLGSSVPSAASESRP